MPKDPEGRGGAAIMAGVALMAIACAGVPMLAGVGLVALIPGLGALHQPFAWMALHVLWMYPVLWLVGTVTDSVARHLAGPRRPGWFGTLVGDLIVWWAVAMMFTVMLSDTLGALLAAAIAVLLMKPFATWLERNTPEQDLRDGGEPHLPAGG